MKKAILGKKLGMTQVFDETGLMIPVTVVEAGPMTVIRNKTVERDGYAATVVAFEDKKGKPCQQTAERRVRQGGRKT